MQDDGCVMGRAGDGVEKGEVGDRVKRIRDSVMIIYKKTGFP